MYKGELQYLSDTLLIEKLLTIEEGLTKRAGIVDTFRSVASAIQEQVSERVQRDGVLATIINYLTPTVMFRIWAPLGFLSMVASEFGVNIGAIMSSMLGILKPKIESGAKLTLDEVNSVGKSVAESVLGESMSATANDDMFFYLRQIEKKGELTKLIRTAQLKRTFKAAPWLKGTGGVLNRIFGTIGRLNGKWLIAGIVIWFVKAVLIGAGVVEGTEVVKKIVLDDKPDASYSGRKVEDKAETEKPTINKINFPPIIAHNLKPSGQGIQYHINDKEHLWIVPLIGRDLVRTLISWAELIYPEVKGHHSEIRSEPSFINLVSILSKGINPSSPGYLVVPNGLHTRKEIVDRFIGPVAKKIQKESNES